MRTGPAYAGPARSSCRCGAANGLHDEVGAALEEQIEEPGRSQQACGAPEQRDEPRLQRFWLEPASAAPSLRRAAFGTAAMVFSLPALSGAFALIAAVAGMKFLGMLSSAPESTALQAAPPQESAAAPVEMPGKRPATPSELKTRYPIVSLSSRLEYEARRRAQTDRPDPKLAAESRRRLDELDERYGGKTYGTVRSESLRLLHSNQVEKFMKSEGFGMSRMVTIKLSPQHLPYPEPEALPLAAASADDLGDDPVATITLPERGVMEDGGGAWTPSREILTTFHNAGEQVFASPWSLGWVKDRDHVTGFVSHGFNYIPELMHPENLLLPPDPPESGIARESRPARWKIGRLELVSLLKHEEPAVYISENLPRMKDLEKAPTRPVTDFERQALESLRAGEDVVTAPSTNAIFMVGAVRAIQQCTACHAARRGELLGAFSYRLQRSPPLKVPARAIKPPA
jgi:hypothetical protein